MKIQNYIRAVFVLVLIATLFLIYSSYQYIDRANKTYEWIDHTRNVLEKLSDISPKIRELESEIKTYIASSNTSYLISVNSRKGKLRGHVTLLKHLTHDNRVQQENIMKLEHAIEIKLKFLDEVISSHQNAGNTALSLWVSSREKANTDSVNVAISLMQAEERRLLTIRLSESRRITEKRFISSVILALLAILFLTVALLRISRENRLRRLAESRLRANKEKYRGLIENSAVVVYTADLNGCFTYTSNKCKELTGYHSSDLQNQHYTMLIDDEWKERVSNFYVNQFHTQTAETLLEFPIRTKSGEQKWVEQSAVLIYDQQQPIGYQCIVIDITAKKNVECKLREAEAEHRQKQEEYQAKLQAILDNIPMSVYIKDLDGRYLLVNKEFKNVYGKSDDSIIGKTSLDLHTNKESVKKLEAAEDRLRQTLQPIELEDVMGSGEEATHILVTKFPLFDQNNHLFAIGGVDKNITDMVHNRQQLIDARLRAEMAEKLQEEFLANMSHEIRTPMNGIIGMANLLDQTSLNSDQKEFVQLIRQSSDTLLMLINDILDLSKIKAGRMSVELIDFSLLDTVDRVLLPFKLKGAEKGIRIQKFIDPKIPEYLKGDQHKLIQILNNLVSNAVKFTESGSVDVYVDLINNGGQNVALELKVEDTGMGIAPGQIDYIFESFAQAGSDMVRRFGGTGLGLAITKRLIELQGGTISVKSTLGGGSCFSFIIEYGLGIKPDTSHSEASGINGNWAKVLTGKKVLLIEDNEINQKVTMRMLENQRMIVDVADNGKEGVLKLEKEAYDIVIMDLQMPVMDGFQTTTYIRNKLNLRTPIIAMTASALRNEHEKCLNLGMNVYMTKPFIPEELFRQLQRLLGSSNATSEWDNTEEKVEVQEKLYDLAYLKELEDDEYMAEVLQIFLNTTPETLQIIKEQYARENWEEVYLQAHKLKSSLGILQMNNLLKNISEIELLAKEQVHKEKVPELVKQSIEMYQLIRPMLEADLNSVKKLSA